MGCVFLLALLHDPPQLLGQWSESCCCYACYCSQRYCVNRIFNCSGGGVSHAVATTAFGSRNCRKWRQQQTCLWMMLLAAVVCCCRHVQITPRVNQADTPAKKAILLTILMKTDVVGSGYCC